MGGPRAPGIFCKRVVLAPTVCGRSTSWLRGEFVHCAHLSGSVLASVGGYGHCSGSRTTPMPCFRPWRRPRRLRSAGDLLSLVQSRLCCQDGSRFPGSHSPNGRALPVGWAYYLFATRPPLRAVAVVVGTAVGVMLVFAVTKLLSAQAAMSPPKTRWSRS
jgi:hypothetical protein